MKSPAGKDLKIDKWCHKYVAEAHYDELVKARGTRMTPGVKMQRLSTHALHVSTSVQNAAADVKTELSRKVQDQGNRVCEAVKGLGDRVCDHVDAQLAQFKDPKIAAQVARTIIAVDMKGRYKGAKTAAEGAAKTWQQLKDAIEAGALTDRARERIDKLETSYDEKLRAARIAVDKFLDKYSAEAYPDESCNELRSNLTKLMEEAQSDIAAYKMLHMRAERALDSAADAKLALVRDSGTHRRLVAVMQRLKDAYANKLHAAKVAVGEFCVQYPDHELRQGLADRLGAFETPQSGSAD